MQLPVTLQSLVDRAIAVARTKLEAGEEIPGLAFVDAQAAIDKVRQELGGAAAHEGLIMIPMTPIPSKDAWAKAVRKVSSVVEARFVMVVSEIWMTSFDTEAEVDQQMAKHKEVRLIPGRKEALMVQIETHDGLWQGIGELTPRGKGKTFGVIELKMPAHNEGRLVGLLGSRRGKPS